MVKLVCVVEVEDAATVEQAEARLDAFREAVLPSLNYGVTIYRADEQTADTAIYLPAEAGAYGD